MEKKTKYPPPPTLGRAEKKRSEAERQKSTFVTRSRRLLLDVGVVMSKLWLAKSFLKGHIEELEDEDQDDEDASFAGLQQEMKEVMSKVPPASSSPSAAAMLAELQAIMVRERGRGENEYYIPV